MLAVTRSRIYGVTGEDFQLVFLNPNSCQHIASKDGQIMSTLCHLGASGSQVAVWPWGNRTRSTEVGAYTE